MIHVLHGENTDDSERYLKSLLVNYKDIPKVQLTDKDRIELFQEAVYAEDLFETEKLVICRNWISSKKIKLNSLSEIPKNRTVIFLEDTKLTVGQKVKRPSDWQIKEFKLQSTIFWFLDSLSPDFSKSARYLPQIAPDKKNLLVWNLLFRVSLLIAAKYRAGREESQDFFERNILDWQWDKIQRQADLFSLNKLIGLYRGLLRLDYTIKNSLSAIDEKSLVTVLLLKYLSP